MKRIPIKTWKYLPKYIKNFLIFFFFCISLLIFSFKAYSINELGDNKEDIKWDQKNFEEISLDILNKVPPEIKDQIEYFLKYYSNDKKEVVERWFVRCFLFLPYFKSIFQEYEIPEDLVYLAYIESGCNPLATSPAGAVGIWQFVESTGKRFGLEISDWIDERRDFIKSTYAAAKYLKVLYKVFGDWRIAIASYNSGEGKIKRILEAKNFINYWELITSDHLSPETNAYFPQWIAITLIAKNPEMYGFFIEKKDPLYFEKVPVNGTTDLKVFAIAGEIDYQLLLLINAELRRKVTPPEIIYFLKIPEGKRELLFKNLALIKTIRKEKKFGDKKIEIITLDDEI